MNLTTDQYYSLSKLDRWYNKYTQQFIDISGVIGTGTWELVQLFIENTNLDAREVMYLSPNQKQVLELAFRKYHSYYIYPIIYNYIRIVDFESLPVVNGYSKEVKYEWKKEVRKRIDVKYKLIVVLDSSLLNFQTIQDLSTFGIPIILLKDPMLLPASDTYTFLRDANIKLYELNPEYLKDPIAYFAHKILNRERLDYGNYDNVSIVPRKQINLFNLRSSDMNIAISDTLRDSINRIYRERILKRKDMTTVPNERVVAMNTMYSRKITNQDNKKVKVYLSKGTVGTLPKVNKHAVGTKYVNVDFQPEFYHESFTGLIINRHYLNKVELPSQQMIPDEIANFEYAYALTVQMSRLSHWDKVTLIVDNNQENDPDLQQMLLYTAITRAVKSLTIVI